MALPERPMGPFNDTTARDVPGDAVLDALQRTPFELAAPVRQNVPFVFASPHSGRLYPAQFVRQSRLTALNLRRSEDAFVDQLFAGAIAIGAPLIAARFPRAFVDANRAPSEIDAAMFDGELSTPIDALSPRVTAGLGVIPRIIRDGAEIYRAKVPAQEAVDRLTLFHRPYHEAVARLLQATRERFGLAILIDCHSMPSVAAAPDIVLGDRYGLAADPLITRAAEQAFVAQGFRVVRNVPYAGGYTTQLYGSPALGMHALQVEVNRGLYLDEDRVQRAAGFDDVARRITQALQSLIDLASRLLPVPLAYAAE